MWVAVDLITGIKRALSCVYIEIGQCVQDLLSIPCLIVNMIFFWGGGKPFMNT